MFNTTTPYKQVFSAIPAPVILLDTQGHFAFANKAAYTILPSCIPLSDGVSCTPPDWLAAEIDRFLKHQKDEHTFEHCLPLESGQRHIQFTLTRLDQDKHQSGILITLHDISRHKRTEQALRQSEERYRMLVEHQSDLVVRVDTDGRLQFASPSFCMMFGIDEEQLVGRELCPIINNSGQGMMKEAMKRLDCYPKSCYYEINSQTLDGPRWIGWAMKGVVDEKGSIEAIVGIGRDITDRKKAEKEILQLAHYDTLTGLPNRSLFHDRLSQAISLSSRNGSSLAVLFLDLDRFKHVNDAFGHQIGDLLLKEVSRRLNSCVRATDTVARIGGDEFVIILNSLVKCSQAGAVASKIVNAMSHPFQLGGHELYSGVSVGIALFPADGTDVDTLLKHADIAMYQAKECGRGTFKFFSPDHNEKMVQRMQLEQALRRAIEHQELFLDYQPQIDNATGAITGVEALVRWNHPQYGLLLPGLFISIAEDTGLIIPLGEWVLRTACHQAKAWQRAGHRQLRMAVNISPRQFQQRGLMPMIDAILQETGCDPKTLELELTETTLMDNPDEAAALLKALKRRGISLAIDDFGTGYSSLSHLKHFPIDRLKIDRSFINDLTHSPEDGAIVEAIIAMAHRLHLEAVAEGVEYREQCTMLHNWGCTTSQGFLFSRPLPAPDLTSLLASGQNNVALPIALAP